MAMMKLQAMADALSVKPTVEEAAEEILYDYDEDEEEEEEGEEEDDEVGCCRSGEAEGFEEFEFEEEDEEEFVSMAYADLNSIACESLSSNGIYCIFRLSAYTCAISFDIVNNSFLLQ